MPVVSTAGKTCRRRGRYAPSLSSRLCRSVLTFTNRARASVTFIVSMTSEPAIVSMRCLAAEPGATYDWHDHPFYEFTFLSDDEATVGYGDRMRPARPGALLFYHCRERHAGWSGADQRPHFWVVHFTAPEGLLRDFPSLHVADPERRHWNLLPEHGEAFRWMFLQILSERTRRAPHQTAAEAAWLRLLLINVHRWTTKEAFAPLTPGHLNPDLMKIWHLVNACVGQPAEFQQRIHELPNYDSLRHGFKRAFGCSPREMMLRLRIQHAKKDACLLAQSILRGLRRPPIHAVVICADR
ncbi:MAG: hypothetical protein GEU99_01015 [Luteitalea sp.]|nr:hypothetical protein [Luteitalea sp.]